jgi:hypothetical protein
MPVGWIRPMTSVPLSAYAANRTVWPTLRGVAPRPVKVGQQSQAVESQDSQHN